MSNIPEPPKALPGFEKNNRHWDDEYKAYIVKIAPGEFYVCKNNEIIATTLGSCISACIHDRQNHIGGMNHFLLPIQTSKTPRQQPNLLSDATRYGNWAMEYLVNEILKNGGIRKNLEVKIFGGGQVLQNMADIGEGNINFVLKYIDNEGLKLTGQDVGGIYPRKVLYFPQTGVVKIKQLKTFIDHSIFQQEQEYFKSIKSKRIGGDIELF